MIEFKRNGKVGKINESFEVSFSDKEEQDLLQTMLDVMLVDFQPYAGDPFLTFAETLKKSGYEVTKAEPQNDGEEETVY